MIIEQDKANPKIYVASGTIFGHYVIAEGADSLDAFTQWMVAATEAVSRELSPSSNTIN